MSEIEQTFPVRKKIPFSSWSPSIHYAQHQLLNTGALPARRIYDFELLYVYRGTAATTINGQRHLAQQGQLLFIPAGVLHQNEAVSEPNTHFLGIHFDFLNDVEVQKEDDIVVDQPSPAAEAFAVEPISEPFPALSQQAVYTPPAACVQLMEQLTEEFAARPAGYELMCRSLMLHILVMLLRQSRLRYDDAPSQHHRKLLKLIAQMETEYAFDWTNKYVAKQLKLSIDHAAKLFREVTGLPPHAYVQTIRHREARRLLRETDLSIERIGEQLGYAGIHYFSRLFKKYEGISPTEYRKLSRVL